MRRKKKKNISETKRILIATSEIRNASIKGTFFKQKLPSTFQFISSLRAVSLEKYPFVIEQYEKSTGISIVEKRKFSITN